MKFYEKINFYTIIDLHTEHFIKKRYDTNLDLHVNTVPDFFQSNGYSVYNNKKAMVKYFDTYWLRDKIKDSKILLVPAEVEITFALEDIKLDGLKNTEKASYYGMPMVISYKENNNELFVPIFNKNKKAIDKNINAGSILINSLSTGSKGILTKKTNFIKDTFRKLYDVNVRDLGGYNNSLILNEYTQFKNKFTVCLIKQVTCKITNKMIETLV